jgi:hypothetical protein
MRFMQIRRFLDDEATSFAAQHASGKHVRPALSRSIRKASGATWNRSNENGLDVSGEFLIAS